MGRDQVLGATSAAEGNASGEKKDTDVPFDLACSLLVAQWIQAEPYRCWRNAALSVLLLPELFAAGGGYVEGWIVLPRQQSVDIIEHGWCQQADGQIIDPSILLVEPLGQPIAYFPGHCLSREELCRKAPGATLPLARWPPARQSERQYEGYRQAYEQAWQQARIQAAHLGLEDSAIKCLPRDDHVVRYVVVSR